jgi:alpha-tubulin suppressor-like RCC1 family protein
VWAWGSINAGQLGNTDTISKLTPVSVRGEIKTFCQISMGNCHAAAIDKNGRLWSWGNNISGQLGNNDLRIKLTPVSVVGTVKTFCKISIGNNHTVAIDKNGRLWSWGTNDSGQLGTNSTTSQRTPVSVLGNIKTFCEIQVITNFSSALDKNGRVWSWGINFAGQIGDNSTTSKSTPVAILGSTKTFCKISAGLNYSMAIDKNGRAWGWGINSEGQLGDNSVTSRLTPVSVLGATKTFCKIAAGGSHTVAIDKNGRLWSWGLNGSGQLGINSTTSQRTPVSVLGNIKTFCEIAAGDCHTLAIDKYGRLWSWGMNSVGQLGINSTTSQRTPVSVLGTIKTFCKIEVSTSVNAAIDKNGRAWTWGLNNSGPLGINEGERLTPVRVYNL